MEYLFKQSPSDGVNHSLSFTFPHLSTAHLVITTKGIDTTASKLNRLSSILEMTRKRTGNSDLQVSALEMLLKVANHPGIPMVDLETAVGVSQATVSRNVKKLGKGSRSKPGAGLVEAYEDPNNGRRKLVKLSASGERFIEALMQR